MQTCKSPRKVMLVAHQAAQDALPVYAHRCSPKKYTQHQLFACLVLKAHQKKDYRGVWELLIDCPDLRVCIGLKTVPHYTTFQKAMVRLLKSQNVERLLEATLRLLRPEHRVEHSAADSTGFNTHHASRYFIWRSQQTRGGKTPKKQVSYRRYGKLMVLACCASHVILGAVASAGPSPDVDQLQDLLGHVAANVRIERLVADAGFDSATNHRLLREEHGIISTIPAQMGRPSTTGQLPADRYRRLMKTRFNRHAYRRRPQVETVISMLKRNLGESLRGRTYHSRRRDMLLMVLCHNIAIVLYIWWMVFYRAGRS